MIHVQALVSEYEWNKLRPYREMVARFAVVFGVTTDELIGLNVQKQKHKTASFWLQKRMLQIENFQRTSKKFYSEPSIPFLMLCKKNKQI